MCLGDPDDLGMLPLPQVKQVNAGCEAVELHLEGCPVGSALDGASLQVNQDPIDRLCHCAGIDANAVVSGDRIGGEMRGG